MPKQVAVLLPGISMRTVGPPTLLPLQPAPRRAAAQPFATISAATRPPTSQVSAVSCSKLCNSGCLASSAASAGPLLAATATQCLEPHAPAWPLALFG
jgi:hypothetical protein